MFNFKDAHHAVESTITKLRCPACRHAGAFSGLINCGDAAWILQRGQHANGSARHVEFRAGMRRCPNEDCNAVIFVELEAGRLTVSYPAEVIDFDATNLPTSVLADLEEAIKCHGAGCHRAAALMVRRTLEDLCADKGVSGGDLKKRISALRTTITISDDLLAAADELRLLGNDAAHIEAKAYDAIETEEIEVAIELAKELLKAVYQHTSLVARLKALKKPTP